MGKSLFELIDAERERRRMNWRQLSLKTGIPSSSFTKWEDGTQKPSLDSVVKIADAWGMSIDHLIGRIPQPKDPERMVVLTEQEWEIVKAHRGNAELRAAINKVVAAVASARKEK
jgi:transcriptional regulator with XRE-family HTH domain